MQGIYSYIPQTNYIPREYSVAAILLLLFMVLLSLVPVLNLLYFYISTFRSKCAVPNMAVFHSSFISIIIIVIIIWGTRWCSWWRYCATRLKVAGSIPDSDFGIFNLT